MSKFITLHRASDNTTILLNSECVVLATVDTFGNTAILTTESKLADDDRTFYVNESTERVRTMLNDAGIHTVLVHGCDDNSEILITVDNILSITANNKSSLGDGNKKLTTGSVINLKQSSISIESIECHETYIKIANQF